MAVFESVYMNIQGDGTIVTEAGKFINNLTGSLNAGGTYGIGSVTYDTGAAAGVTFIPSTTITPDGNTGLPNAPESTNLTNSATINSMRNTGGFMGGSVDAIRTLTITVPANWTAVDVELPMGSNYGNQEHIYGDVNGHIYTDFDSGKGAGVDDGLTLFFAKVIPDENNEIIVTVRNPDGSFSFHNGFVLHNPTDDDQSIPVSDEGLIELPKQFHPEFVPRHIPTSMAVAELDRSNVFGKATVWAFFAGMGPFIERQVAGGLLTGFRGFGDESLKGSLQSRSLITNEVATVPYSGKGYTGKVIELNQNVSSTTGNGFDFGEGVEGQIKFPDRQNFTIWAAIKPIGAGATSAHDPRVLSRDTGTGANDHMYMLGLNGGTSVQQVRARLRFGGSTATYLVTETNIQNDSYNFLAVTYDGANVTVCHIREDGTTGSLTTSATGDLGEDSSAGMGLSVGRSYGSKTNIFIGEILGTGVIDGALSINSLKQLSNDITQMLKPAAPVYLPLLAGVPDQQLLIPLPKQFHPDFKNKRQIPTGEVLIDKTNQFTKKLEFALVGGDVGTVTDLVHGIQASGGESARDGLALTTTSNMHFDMDSRIDDLIPLTIITRLKVKASVVTAQVLLHYEGGGRDWRIDVPSKSGKNLRFTRDGSGGDAVIETGNDVYVEDEYVDVVMRWDGTNVNNLVFLSVDGVEYQGTTAGSFQTDAGGNIRIGAGGSFSFEYLYLFREFMTKEQANAIVADPFQLVKPLAPVYYPVIVGEPPVGGPVTGVFFVTMEQYLSAMTSLQTLTQSMSSGLDNLGTPVNPTGKVWTNDYFDGDGVLGPHWEQFFRSTSAPYGGFEDVERVNDFLEGDVTTNTGDGASEGVTLWFEEHRGRLDYQEIQIPVSGSIFVYFYNGGISPIGDRTADFPSDDTYTLFAGPIVHKPDLSTAGYKFNVIGHRGANKNATIENKTTTPDDQSSVNDEGENVLGIGVTHADFRVEITSTGVVRFSYKAVGSSDPWILTNGGTGLTPTSFGEPWGTLDSSDTLLLGFIGYQYFFNAGPFKFSLDAATTIEAIDGIVTNPNFQMEGTALSVTSEQKLSGTFAKNLDEVGFTATNSLTLVGTLSSTLADFVDDIDNQLRLEQGGTFTFEELAGTNTGALTITGSPSFGLGDIQMFNSVDNVVLGAFASVLGELSSSNTSGLKLTGLLSNTLAGNDSSSTNKQVIETTLDKALLDTLAEVTSKLVIQSAMQSSINNVLSNNTSGMTLTGTLNKVLSDVTSVFVTDDIVRVQGVLNTVLEALALASDTNQKLSGTLSNQLSDNELTNTSSSKLTGLLDATLEDFEIVVQSLLRLVGTIDVDLIGIELSNLIDGVLGSLPVTDLVYFSQTHSGWLGESLMLIYEQIVTGEPYGVKELNEEMRAGNFLQGRYVWSVEFVSGLKLSTSDFASFTFEFSEAVARGERLVGDTYDQRESYLLSSMPTTFSSAWYLPARIE